MKLLYLLSFNVSGQNKNSLLFSSKNPASLSSYQQNVFVHSIFLINPFLILLMVFNEFNANGRKRNKKVQGSVLRGCGTMTIFFNSSHWACSKTLGPRECMCGLLTFPKPSNM